MVKMCKQLAGVLCLLKFPLQTIGEQKKKQLEKKIESWSCLPEGVLKINVDAAYDADQGLGWYGSNS
jgi:hypothetical protein